MKVLTHQDDSPILSIRYAGPRILNRLITENCYVVSSDRLLSESFFNELRSAGFFGKGLNFRRSDSVVSLKSAPLVAWEDGVIVPDPENDRRLSYEKKIYTYTCYVEYDAGD